MAGCGTGVAERGRCITSCGPKLREISLEAKDPQSGKARISVGAAGAAADPGNWDTGTGAGTGCFDATADAAACVTAVATLVLPPFCREVLRERGTVGAGIPWVPPSAAIGGISIAAWAPLVTTCEVDGKRFLANAAPAACSSTSRCAMGVPVPGTGVGDGQRCIGNELVVGPVGAGTACNKWEPRMEASLDGVPAATAGG